MHPDRANEIADGLLAGERAARAKRQARLAGFHEAFGRFHAGVLALVGFYAGVRIAKSWLGQPEWGPVIGIVLGLFMAVTIHGRRR